MLTSHKIAVCCATNQPMWYISPTNRGTLFWGNANCKPHLIAEHCGTLKPKSNEKEQLH